MDADFFVVSHQRSGSTYFCRLLSTHPDVVCLEELFNPANVGIHNEYIVNKTGYMPEDVDKRDSDPHLFMKTIREATLPKLLGFKIFLEHQQYAKRELVQSGIKRIILKRNLLMSYSSWLAAYQANHWHSEYRPGDAPSPMKKALAVFRAADFFKWADEIETFYAKFRDGPFIEVDYESLSDSNTLNKISEFLGVTPHFDQNKVNLSKILKEDPSSRFVNLDEIIETLSGSRYEKLLSPFIESTSSRRVIEGEGKTVLPNSYSSIQMSQEEFVSVVNALKLNYDNIQTLFGCERRSIADWETGMQRVPRAVYLCLRIMARYNISFDDAVAHVTPTDVL